MAGPKRWKIDPQRRAGYGTVSQRTSTTRFELALELEQSEQSPRELAVRFTDERIYFVSEPTIYRLVKARDLIISPAYLGIKAARAFHTQTTRPNEMWQADFAYFKIIGWGEGNGRGTPIPGDPKNGAGSPRTNGLIALGRNQGVASGGAKVGSRPLRRDIVRLAWFYERNN